MRWTNENIISIYVILRNFRSVDFNSFLICKVKWSWFHFKAIEAWKWRYSNNKIIIILRPNKEINHRKMFGKVKSKKPQAVNINRMVVASRIWFCLYVWNLNFLAILLVYFWVPSRLLNSIAYKVHFKVFMYINTHIYAGSKELEA